MAVDEAPGPLAPGDASTRRELIELIERVERATGHPPLSEPSRLAWAAGEGDVLVARAGDGVVGSAHLVQRDGAWNIELVWEPGAAHSTRRRGLLRAAAALARERGALEIRYWAFGHRPPDDDLPLGLGFDVERDLLQMRVGLPLAHGAPVLEEGFALRAFRPGSDEAPWLEVNNRAFAAHPEQGHWDLPTLLERESTAWFDPAGFLVCEAEGQMAGSCWTKLHTGVDPELGEIYVISVDPAFQRHGLGRTLVLAGLDWLAGRVAVGMLYVERDNAPAVELYRSLGFATDHTDRCYLWRAPVR